MLTNHLKLPFFLLLLCASTHSVLCVGSAEDNLVRKKYKTGKDSFGIFSPDNIHKAIIDAEKKLDRKAHSVWPQAKKFLKASLWAGGGSLSIYGAYWLNAKSETPSSLGGLAVIAGIASYGWSLKKLYDGFVYQSKNALHRNRLAEYKASFAQTNPPHPALQHSSHESRFVIVDDKTEADERS